MSEQAKVLVRVVAPSFVAGLEVDPRSRTIVNAAPILRRIAAQHGWRWDWVRAAIRARRGWKIEVIR